MAEYACSVCEETFDTDVDWYNVSRDGKEVCESCWENEGQYASTITFYGPDTVDYGDRYRVYVTDLYTQDIWGEDPRNLTITRTYHRTDAWRGYHVTTIDGWTEMVDGWTTGSWGDSTSDRKAPFNEWLQQLHDGDIAPPCEVAVIVDLTSNVFSVGMSVWVPTDDADVFRSWLGADAQMLEDALA